MTGQQLHARWCALWGQESNWPGSDGPVDTAKRRAWDELAAELEVERDRAVAEVIARREAVAQREPKRVV